MNDRVSVSRDVGVAPERAFEAFTAEVGDWYRVDRFTVMDHTRTVTLRFEPHVGGRFLDVYDEATGEGREMGRIQVWDPPHRFQFLDNRDCEVEVTFVPIARGTRVRIEQRGLDRLPPEVAAHVREYGWHTVSGWFHDHMQKETAMATTSTDTTTGSIVPYLFYDDPAEMLEWYSRVFGWVETGRWEDDGRIHNAEMNVGASDVWLDGGGRKFVEHDGEPFQPWIGVWADPDEMYERVRAAGVEVDPPEDKPYGVRMLTVADPAGYQWGFMRRT